MTINYLEYPEPSRNLPWSKNGNSPEKKMLMKFLVCHSSMLKAERERVSVIEFPVSGYGVADYICLHGKADSQTRENVMSWQFPTLLAFEMKINDWRRAISQAYRYKFYANASYVVLPMKNAEKAFSSNVDLFRHLEVGLWGYDSDNDLVKKFYSPRRSVPLCRSARKSVMGQISEEVKAQQLL